MKKIFLLLAGALLLAACYQKPKQPVAEKPTVNSKFLISCQGVGEVKFSDSFQDLEKKFGSEALSQHENTVKGIFTSLWYRESKQLNIFWQEKKPPFKTIKYIEIEGDGAPYKTENGLMIGISLRDMVKLNGGMPVTFHNFFIDSDGKILSFNNGDIQKNNPCLGGSLEIIKQRNINVNDLKALKKQQTLESYDHYMERVEAALVSITVSPADSQN